MIEDGLLKIAEKMKVKGYSFSEGDFIGLRNLTAEELLLGKITNIISFIILQWNNPDTRV